MRESADDELWKDCEATILNLPFDLLPEISYRPVTLFSPNRVIGSEHKVKRQCYKLQFRADVRVDLTIQANFFKSRCGPLHGFISSRSKLSASNLMLF